MLKELKAQHRNIVQMSFNGYKNVEIAERLGLTPATVSNILRSPLGQAYLNGLQDRAQEATLDVRKKLVSLNESALSTYARMLNPEEKAPHSVQFNVAKDVLDRNGYKAPDKLNIDMTLQTKTDEELDAEITAIEAAIKRTTFDETGISNNLPENSTNNLVSTQNSCSHNSPPCSTDDDSPQSCSLEDYPKANPDRFDPLENISYDSDPFYDEDDLTIFANPDFDPFNNIKG